MFFKPKKKINHRLYKCRFQRSSVSTKHCETQIKGSKKQFKFQPSTFCLSVNGSESCNVLKQKNDMYIYHELCHISFALIIMIIKLHSSVNIMNTSSYYILIVNKFVFQLSVRSDFGKISSNNLQYMQKEIFTYQGYTGNPYILMKFHSIILK